MSEERKHNRILLDSAAQEGADVLPEEVAYPQTPETISERDRALCDGEGGRAPAKGTLGG